MYSMYVCEMLSVAHIMFEILLICKVLAIMERTDAFDINTNIHFGQGLQCGCWGNKDLRANKDLLASMLAYLHFQFRADCAVLKN